MKKPKESNKQLISFTLNETTVDKFYAYAQENAINKSALVDKLILKEIAEKTKK